MIKIGELSNMTGVSIQTIRFYESEGLISPIEVDRWTNYRYYDESSVIRLSEIVYLKNLGFSLKEIKVLDEAVIKEKIEQLNIDMDKIKRDIQELSALRKKEGGFNMKTFVNDELVIGKWKKVATVKSIEDYKNNNFIDSDIFDFEELYFLENGEPYWCFRWTKGIIYMNERAFPYEIVDGKLFVSVVDALDGSIDDYAVYEQVDNKKYAKKDIEIKDNINIPFIKDSAVLGSWEAVDFVENFAAFTPGVVSYPRPTFLRKYTFEPDGTLLVTFREYSDISSLNWSKGVVINKYSCTASEYVIHTIGEDDYLCVEWKSGDYVYGGFIAGYYVFKRMK